MVIQHALNHKEKALRSNKSIRKAIVLILLIISAVIVCFVTDCFPKRNPPTIGSMKSEYKEVKRKCFSAPLDFGGPLQGEWQVAMAEPPWFSLSCKYQPASTSCLYYELPVDRRSERLSKLRFFPKTCLLQGFDPEEFLELLKGRVLVIAGDSLSQQLFLSLMCRLENFVTLDNVVWGNQSQRMKNFCGINGKCVPKYGRHSSFLESYSNPIWATFKFNVTIRYISIKADPIDEKLSFIASFTTKQDILVLNKGAWRQNGYTDFKNRMLEFERYYAKNKDILPSIWWRETNPQHFRGQNGDYVPGKTLEKGSKTCVKPQKSRLRTTHVDPVNSITNTIMTRQRIPIMYTSNAMVSQYNAHLFKSGMDCSHLCTPGIESIWVDYLFNWLKFEDIVKQLRIKEVKASSTFV